MSDLKMQIAFENVLRKKAAAGLVLSSVPASDAGVAEPTSPPAGAPPETPKAAPTKRRAGSARGAAKRRRT
jgi:hypothetical protein